MKNEDIVLSLAFVVSAYLVWVASGKPSVFGFSPSTSQSQYEGRSRAAGVEPFSGLYSANDVVTDP